MEVTISTSQLIQDVRNAFLQEVKTIPEEVLSARNGSALTEDEFERCLVLADSTTRQSVVRFLIGVPDGFGDNAHEIPENYIFNFTGSLRRLGGRAQILTDLVANSMKELALSEAFKSLSPEISSLHNERAVTRLAQIDSLLLTKYPPFKII